MMQYMREDMKEGKWAILEREFLLFNFRLDFFSVMSLKNLIEGHFLSTKRRKIKLSLFRIAKFIHRFARDQENFSLSHIFIRMKIFIKREMRKKMIQKHLIWRTFLDENLDAQLNFGNCWMINFIRFTFYENISLIQKLSSHFIARDFSNQH